MLPSPAHTRMFVPAPLSKAAPALKEELTDGHCDGVSDGRVFRPHTQQAWSPRFRPHYCDVIFSRLGKASFLLSRPRCDERRGSYPIGVEKSRPNPAPSY